MNRIVRQVLVAAVVAMPGAVAAQVREEPVKVDLEGVPPYARAQVEARAREGITELRRYLERTAHIHGVRLADIVVREEPAASARAPKEEPKVAGVRDPAKK